MTKISTTYVPDEGNEHSKVVFVGEAPGADEEREKRPFIGESGNILMTCLGRNGLVREEVMLRNLCHYRPDRNKFKNALGTPQLMEGINELYDNLRKTRPTVIIPLGNWPLFYVTGKRGKQAGSGIANWRGSILPCSVEGLEGTKVIPTYHPAYVLRDRSVYPIFDQDIKRAISDSAFPELRLPTRELITNPTGAILRERIEQLLDSGQYAVDIETYGTTTACVGFSCDPAWAISILVSGNAEAHEALLRLLESPAKKIYHFGIFDTTFLRQFSPFKPTNWWWDTYVAQQTMWPELPRSLAYLTSIYTREPYYKMEREGVGDQKSWTRTTKIEQLLAYNCKDACVTAEVQREQEKEMAEGPKGWRKTFVFQMAMQPVAQHISESGMLIDQERRELLEQVMMVQWASYQSMLDRLAGCEINAGSPKQVCELLYDVLKLPVRKKRGAEDDSRTADEDALVSLIAFCKNRLNELVQAKAKAEWQKKFLILKLIIIIRGIRKLLSSYIRIALSSDSRARSLYKMPGTETGRGAAEKFIDGTGLNAQTYPRDPIEISKEDLEKLLEVANETN